MIGVYRFIAIAKLVAILFLLLSVSVKSNLNNFNTNGAVAWVNVKNVTQIEVYGSSINGMKIRLNWRNN